MKLGLSKKGDPRGKHLVFVVDKGEGLAIERVLIDEVLMGAIPVRDFDPIRKIFVYRFHMRFLQSIMLVFPYTELSPALDKWFIAQEKKKMKAIPVPELEIPGFYDYKAEVPAQPYDFQKIAIDEIEKHIDGLLEEAHDLASQSTELAAFFLNDEMGLGKTVVSMAIAVRNRWFPMLYVGPNGGKGSTKRIIDRFFDDDFTYQVVDGTRAKRAEQIISGADVTIANFEATRGKKWYDRSAKKWSYQWDNPEFFYECAEPMDQRAIYTDAEQRPRRIWNYVVIDEHHRCKNPDAQVTTGMQALLGEHWLFMSGTPIMNRLEEIWTVLHKIDPEKWPTYYKFCKDICIENHSGTVVGYKPDKVIEVRDYLRARSLRRRRDHISDDLPDVVYVQRDVELTAEQRRLYNEIRDELIVELDDGSKKKVTNPFTLTTRLRQACFSPELYGGSKKSAKIMEMKIDVEELVASNEKAIIFSQWSKATRILEREFAEYNPAYVDGTVKGPARIEQEDKFNTDDSCKLYIGTIKANQEAITLGAATYVLFADKFWTPMANAQAAGRSAAGGLRGMHLPKGSKVHIIEYFAKDTIEEAIDVILAKKQATFNMLVERDGGVRFPKVTVADVRQLLAA